MSAVRFFKVRREGVDVRNKKFIPEVSEEKGLEIRVSPGPWIKLDLTDENRRVLKRAAASLTVFAPLLP